MKLVGSAEIAALTGVTTQAVHNWTKRFDNFPKPVVELAMGPVWDEDEFRSWAKQHAPNIKFVPTVQFPIATKFFAHSGKEDNYHRGTELGLEGDALETFSRTAYELVFDVEVRKDGSVWASTLNNKELPFPIQL